ncbi:MAG: YggS family pyridoxal phosphate-dependent enzyme [Bacteroidaceae bacterium]|nr:YggS family pyridoxal phosphate-dependent enzyme [Bacteroidaceae bacterium]
MYIAEQIKRLRGELPEGVSLLAISKYQPIEALQEAYDAGQRMFGENHIQEMAAKAAVLPKDIAWHFTGHVQTNKIKYMASFVSLIHAVDSFRLLREINKHAAKHDRIIDCLLQIHIAQEDTKYGLTVEECRELLATEPWRELTNVHIVGLMAMGSNTDDMEQVRGEFRQMKQLFDEVKTTYFADDSSFCQLSEGMTDDYPIAIEEGSTIVRIGSMIFGDRVYH